MKTIEQELVQVRSKVDRAPRHATSPRKFNTTVPEEYEAARSKLSLIQNRAFVACEDLESKSIANLRRLMAEFEPVLNSWKPSESTAFETIKDREQREGFTKQEKATIANDETVANNDKLEQEETRKQEL